MKKYITGIIMTAMLALAVPTFAQTRYCNDGRRSRTYSSRTYTRTYYDNSGYYDSGYSNNGYYNNGYYGNTTSRASDVYNRHRKAVNIGVATGTGAIIGALVGGGRGALIGAAVGAAGGAVVTSRQRPRNYYRYRY